MSSPTWNFADLFDAIAAARPTSPAVDDVQSWSWLAHEQRADALARSFAGAGAGQGAAVAVCLRNSSEFLECYYAAMKAAMVPVNVNYRYGPDELTYILADCDAEVVVIGAEFIDAAAAIIDRLPKVRLWLVVDGEGPLTAPFVSYEQAVADGPGLPSWPWSRSGEDIVLIYTGGTTGMPKGVMWAHTELFEALIGSANRAMNLPPVETIDDLLAAIIEPVPRGLAASPLMHSTGLLNQWMTMLSGGTAVIYRARRLDAEQLLRVLSERRVTSAAIVGDAFGRPLLAALDAGIAGLDLSALTLIVSSGAMFSEEVKAGLLRHLPQASIYDAFGSSEGFGLGVSVSTADTVLETASFRLGPQVRVIRDDGTWVEPGETATGKVAVCGPLPVGYHRDPDRSARTWPVIDGVRYSIPGDYVAVLADGSLTLLGRGSHCINTGGEKVFPEEVEEALKEHPDIVDAACVGRPDERLGAKVCAVVVARPGSSLGIEDVVAQSKGKLASYKAPREVIVVEEIPRTALGKVDYPAVERIVAADLATVDS